MKKYLFLIISLVSSNLKAQNNILKELTVNLKMEQPIQVLNFGTFHMGYSYDAHTVNFDEHNLKNIGQIHEIAEKIATFKPTIIIVETTPGYDQKLQKSYAEYIKNPKMVFKNPSEVELLAYEVGRLANTPKIYGIDHKMGYNYMIGNEIQNSRDQNILNQYYSKADSLDKVFETMNPTVQDRLWIMNQPFYQDFLMNINADLLTHIVTEDGFEGTDQATLFYQRNLRMYSNLNKIKMTKEERIFILMGATHTAFFNQWLSRSPKYVVVNTLDYL